LLTRNIGLRLLEAYYVRTAPPNGADNVQNDLRLSAFAGDPVTVTASAGGLNPKLNAVYS